MIPEIDLQALIAREPGSLAALRRGVEETGFVTVTNTELTASDVRRVLGVYREFFRLPDSRKAEVDMARTGANRGWGASRSEQVDPAANPDYKQVFDCGFELPEEDPLRRSGLSVYAPNQWPAMPPAFKKEVLQYYAAAMRVSMQLLRGIAVAIGAAPDYFDDKFDRPMALLRGNYYPARPAWAGGRDFGIGAHTDYGCLTLLATDGTPGLELRERGGGWRALTAAPGTFIINFGEMLQIWTAGRVRATPHRVIGTAQERLSIPLFFNPRHDANIAPPGAAAPIWAGDHLARRFDETYLHLKSGTGGG